MFGEKAFILIKELDRNRNTLTPYNSDLVKEINRETLDLVKDNQIDLRRHEESRDNSSTSTDSVSYMPAIIFRHVAIKRNIRCNLAYHYNRMRCLREMRWEFGSILPSEIKANLNNKEMEWFSKYSSILARYMRTIGDSGLNLAVDLKPPKALYIEIRCLVDYGQFELSDGSILVLNKNSRHYLPRGECEDLIRQGIFQHIV